MRAKMVAGFVLVGRKMYQAAVDAVGDENEAHLARGTADIKPPAQPNCQKKNDASCRVQGCSLAKADDHEDLCTCAGTRATPGPLMPVGWPTGDINANAHHSPHQSQDGFTDDAPDLSESGALFAARGSACRCSLHSPRQYEVVLTDENIETIDFDLKADLVGISAMTSYVNRGYEIADCFRARGVPVVMGGVHPSFMAREALTHCDAVVVGEAELVMDKLLDDLRRGTMQGLYKSATLHPMVGMALPRYDLLKKNRYVNKTFVQTSRGCHTGCTFCAEPLMNGLKFRYRPVDEVIAEIEQCGSRTISINDADFFGTPERPKEVMRALKGRGVHWQAGVTSKLAEDDRMLELAAESGCTMLSIGFESINRETLKSVHKMVNRPDHFAALVREDPVLRDFGVRPVHVRLRRRRPGRFRRDRELQHRDRL